MEQNLLDELKIKYNNCGKLLFQKQIDEEIARIKICLFIAAEQGFSDIEYVFNKHIQKSQIIYIAEYLRKNKLTVEAVFSHYPTDNEKCRISGWSK